MDRIVAVIPARMASSRFPGKPLAHLHGLPMLEHVFRRVSLCPQLNEVYIATCDDEIRDVAENFGANVIMTSAAHERATDRVAEAAAHFAADIVVMIQGDEPMITPEMIEAALVPFRSEPLPCCVNLIHRLTSQQEFMDPNTIKVVGGVDGDALYSSVLIESVTAGIPSAYVDNLDHGSHDLHRFVAAGLIYRSDVDPDFEEMQHFYVRPDWTETLRTFANIDQDESAVLADALKSLYPQITQML